MKVVVLGATGGTGQWVVKRLLKAGHQVTVYVRHPEKIKSPSNELTIIEGNLTDQMHLTETFKGQDAVISCLGSNTTKQSSQLKEMAASVLQSMEQSKVQHIVYMATAGIDDEFTGVFKWFIRLILGHVIDDHREAANLYRNSGMVYTIVKPMQLKDQDLTGKYVTAMNGLPSSKKAISRANVAEFMVLTLEDDTYRNQSVALAE